MKRRHKTTHEENLDRVARIEGQVRGIRRMIEQGAYCVDILTQIEAARSALKRVGARILRKHLETCVRDALNPRSRSDTRSKISEIVALFEARSR